MPSGLERTAYQFRLAALRRERAAASAMVRVYGEAYKRLQPEILKVAEEIAAAKAEGKRPSDFKRFQAERLGNLERQILAELRTFAQYADAAILTEQAAAVQAAQSEAVQLMFAGMGPAAVGVIGGTFSPLPTDVLTQLVGTLQNGSPLRTLLDKLGPAASQAIQQAITTGVALGYNPRRIAREARNAAGITLTQTLTISRTEVLKVYRETSRLSYQANNRLVKGWIWLAQLSKRTCAMCWAMHGTKHSLDEPFATHPNCRCAMVPDVASFRELGYDLLDVRPTIEPGAAAFRKLSADDQLAILGPGKLAAYQAGKLDLPELVGRTNSKEWGQWRHELPLYAITQST